MNIAIHRYALESKGRLNSKTGKSDHKGCLLKVKFKDNSIGYADCHPWPEIGDSPLEFHLKLLSQGHHTKLMERSFFFASHDALARSKGESLFKNISIPASQALMTDLNLVTESSIKTLIFEGYQRIKFKMGYEDLEKIQEILSLLLESPLKVRLDFNSKLNLGEFRKVLEFLKPYFKQIEFFEDPIPFNLSLWKKLQKDYGISLACDKGSLNALGFPDSAEYLVLKPAIQDINPFHGCSQKIVITSYLDHPIGQFSAVWNAAALFKGKLDVCGFLTHHSYYANSFIERIEQQGPYLKPPLGNGLGYDDLFEQLQWEMFS